MGRINKKVEPSVHPVFGHDTEELLALRELAKTVFQYLTEDDVELENMEIALAKVREIQKVSKRRN